jgi:hypothetical protein
LQNQVTFFQGLVEARTNLLEHDGLRDVIECPQLETLDRGGHFCHSRKHDDGHIRKAFQGLPEKAHSVHPGHIDIGDTNRYLALSRQQRQRFLARGCLCRGQSVRLDDARQDLSHLRIVVDDQATRRCAVRKARSHVAKVNKLLAISYEL